MMKSPDKLYPYQEQILRGLKPGDNLAMITARARRNGKSQFSVDRLRELLKEQAMKNEWSSWAPMRVSELRESITGKMITGLVYRREHLWKKIDGQPYLQYATKKELFELRLKGGD